MARKKKQEAESYDEPMPVDSQAQRLAALEEAWLPDSPRVDGKIERGHGSHFQEKLSDEQRQHYEHVEAAAKVEEEVEDARMALEAALDRFDDAVERANASEPD